MNSSTYTSVRTSTWRPEALEKGAFILGGIDEKTISQSVDLAVQMIKYEYEDDKVTDYGVLNVSTKVIKLTQGYTTVINSRIWGKLSYGCCTLFKPRQNLSKG